MPVLIGVACLIGCRGGPPVQEMSDARQAIAAARTAGAASGSSAELDAATSAITRAEDHLQAGEYNRARLAAMQAKHHAAVALATTHQVANTPTPVAN